ncbi:MAG: cytochrome c biogenesis protein CcdA [Candidatus Omnitrophota bacterium]
MNLSGSPADYIFAFLGGVAVSFTPCVYPLVPITVSYIGINSTSSFKGFILSLIYVSGVAFIYSALGLLAALSGKFFGSISSHPVTYILVGIIIIIFGLSLFGLFSIVFKGFNFRQRNSQRGRYLSVFLLGLSSGLVVSPCLTPVLGAILSYLATGKNIFYGAGLLASFAYGMGLILILSGSFSGFLKNIPKTGRWMLIFQRLSGIVLLIMGFYFIYTGISRIR